jgi:UDP-N-acetylglucosamine--N-acetylmuramyl-(pentapeptide) pyrophosphoryl-undecaprenol N-acetylglucosamine transferase
MTGTVMITTGGTGGHVFPGLAVAGKLVARGWRVFWLGTRDGLEARLVPQHGIDFESVTFGGIRGKGLRQFVVGPFALLAALWQSVRIIRRRAPDVVLGFGGFASFPGALAGIACAKPLVLHDANAIAGLANRVLAYGADRILSGFPGTFRGRRAAKAEWVGNPLRDAIAALPPPEQRFAGRSGPLALLVVGGSLGAAALNECVPAALALLPGVAARVVLKRARVTSRRCVPPTRAPALRSSARRSSTTWRRAIRTRMSCSAAAARSPWPSSPPPESARSSSRCPGRSPTSRQRTRGFSSMPAPRSCLRSAI